MRTTDGPTTLAALYDGLTAGALSRRAFTHRALALGAGMPVVAFALRAAAVAAGTARPAGGWAVAAQGTGAAPPAVGTEGKTRGQDGELKILQWQAPTQLSPHVSTGTKDYLAAELVLEPLMHYLPDGTIIPVLVTEVPTIENGMLAPDLTAVTYTLLEGVTWSDGAPLTAHDVAFTWRWVTDPANASVSSEVYRIIENVEALDDRTARVTFARPAPNWFEPHTGDNFGYVYPRHVLEADPAAHAAFLGAPVGTGPYVVESFSPGDQVVYVANGRYRDPNRPLFARVNLKGGGDAASAAQAVLQTGDWDYAWNLQVEPAVLAQLAEAGKGRLVSVQGTDVERINLNFSDPNTEVDGQRSQWQTPHPFLSDPAVRRAIALAVDRGVIAAQFYGEGEPPTANILAGLASLESPNTAWVHDPDEANRLLDEAGWTRDGDVRSKDGVELSLAYATSINAVRQKTQAVVKAGLEEIGFKVQLRQVDAAIFFDGAPGNEQNVNHFYTDIDMYTNGPTSPVPVSYMLGWYAGPDGRNIAQRANAWNGGNFGRYASPEYDGLFEAVQGETDIEAAAQLFIRMNDVLIEDTAVVPLVNRAADKYAISTGLVAENVALGPFGLNYWNIANWTRSE